MRFRGRRDDSIFDGLSERDAARLRAFIASLRNPLPAPPPPNPDVQREWVNPIALGMEIARKRRTVKRPT